MASDAHRLVSRDVAKDWMMEEMKALMDKAGSEKGTGHEPLTLTVVKGWTRRMKNEDRIIGSRWMLGRAGHLLEQRGANVDFYVDMALAFLKDKDEPKDKMGRYYSYIVCG